MIKLMIFDHDMTIVDSSYAIMAGFNAVADAVGRPRVDHGQVMRCIAMPLPDFCAALLGECRPEWTRMYVEKSHSLERSLLRPFPDLAPAMTALQAMGLHLAVASNREDPRPTMEQSGTARYFKRLIGARRPDGGRRPFKPAPDMLLELMGDFSATASETLYVGDSDLDIRSALAAGVRGVGITRGNFTREQFETLGAWRVIDSLMELPDIVRAENEEAS